MEINYEVVSAQNLTNLLYKDTTNEEDVKYELGAKEIIVDIPMLREITTKAVYVDMGVLFNSIAGSVK